jgi:hypothetical protein
MDHLPAAYADFGRLRAARAGEEGPDSPLVVGAGRVAATAESSGETPF